MILLLKGTDGGVDTTFLTIDGSAAGAATFNDKIVATELDISGNVDIDGTLEADAITVDGTTLAEFISDTTGAMFSSNTETGITVTYQDGDNTIDLALAAAQTTLHLYLQQISRLVKMIRLRLTLKRQIRFISMPQMLIK